MQIEARHRRSRHILLFALVMGGGVAAGVLAGRGSPLLILTPVLMALAVLGLPVRAALAAGFIAAICTVARAVAAAYQLEPLQAVEWLYTCAFLLTWAALLAAIARTGRYSKLAAATLVFLATPAFIAIVLPLLRSLDTVQRSSTYLAMRDGVRIAADVYLPRGFHARGLPALLHQTRYFRRTELHWPYELLLGGIRSDIRRFVANGYAYIYVDARGSGASFGSRTQEWSDDEIKDGAQVVDWIIRQPWSSGKVGCTGISYDGTACEMLLANQHPAVKAAAPRFSLLDGYTDIAKPGGIYLSWFIAIWGSYNAALDRNALGEKLEGFQKRMVAGVAPVDGHEDLLKQAVASHHNNYDVQKFLAGVTYRDDADANGLTLAHMSPFAKPAIAHSGVPIYSYSGWYDGAYQRAAISRFLTYRVPGRRLIIGPWDHGGRQNISPHLPRSTPGSGRTVPAGPAGFAVPAAPVFDHTGELLRFFDLHLKGVDDGIGAQKPVRYYTMGEEAWKEADTWPPAATVRALYFGEHHALAQDPPAASGSDDYAVDATATSGAGSRWRTYFNPSAANIGYPNRAEADRKLLVYDSAPLAEDLEITGHPALYLWVASSAADGQFFVYLEDVAADGAVTYITEGQLRALHRAQAAGSVPYWEPRPAHSFLRVDAKPLVIGEPAEIAIALLPVSYRIRSGHSIRIALAGADRDQFSPLPTEAPTWRVYRDAARPSRIELPIVTSSAGTSTTMAR